MGMQTHVRAGRVAAIVLGLQAAKGTPVTDFSSADAGRIWTNDARIQLTPDKSDAEGWMTKPRIESAARYNLETARSGRLAVKATPTALEWLLRSNWGPLDAGDFVLSDQVSEWLSVGLVESVLEDSPQYLYRLHDGWIPRLVFKQSAFLPLTVEAEYLAEADSAPVALDSLGGISLPTLPMNPDRNVFPGRLASLVRDPDGAAEELLPGSVEISIDQGLGMLWDQMRGVQEVYKAGYPGPVVRIKVQGHVSTETWEILSRSRAGTKQAFRFTAQAQSPAETLQIDLPEVDFTAEPLGHAGQKFVPFIGEGQAHLDGDGNFVTISLS